MKGTIQKWKFMILLGALLFLSNMTFAEDKINHYTEGIPIDTTAVSISDKTNIPDRLYVDSLSLNVTLSTVSALRHVPDIFSPPVPFSEEKI